MKQYPVAAGAALPAGTASTSPRIDPANGGVVISGAVTATVDTSALATSANQTNKSQFTQVAVSGSQAADSTHGLPIVDQGIVFQAAKTVDCTTATALGGALSLTGAGYITVTNLDSNNTIYLGGSGVTGSTNGEALPAGASRSWRSAAVENEYAIGSTTVNASVRR